MGLPLSQPRSHRVVAIDGPAASGKSSVARALAGRLGFIYVNSGAIYRAITWYMLHEGINTEDAKRLAQAVESSTISCRIQDGECRILLDDVDPTNHLREDDVNERVSYVSRFPVVREIVASSLRENARDHDVVVEGRDIGSVVFPDTPYKFYIDASPEVRLQRRAAQGERDEITQRDYADISRPVSPLVIAKDAYVIDTSALTIEEVVHEILARLTKAGQLTSDLTI
jgi:cytidylate kinase